MNSSHAQWKTLPTTPGYSVSNLGHVRNDKTGKVLKPYVGDRAGHLRVDFPNGRFFVHVLVAEAFIGTKPQGMEVCHNDNDPTNNRVENLRYGTRSSNVLDLRAVRSHCPQGHEYTESNSYYSPEGWRSCKSCRRIARDEYRKKVKSRG